MQILRKIFPPLFLLLSLVLAFGVWSGFTFAAEEGRSGICNCEPDDQACLDADPDCSTVFTGPGLDGGLSILQPLLNGTGIENTSTLITAILFWVRILLIITGVLAFVAFVYAGFLFVTSFVSEENNEKAKKILMYSGMGIIVILLSYSLTNFFINAAL